MAYLAFLYILLTIAAVVLSSPEDEESGQWVLVASMVVGLALAAVVLL